MSRSYLAFTVSTGADRIYFDSVVSYSGVRETMVPEHEVESGANVADNQRPKLDTHQLTVFISNHPLSDTPLDVQAEAFEQTEGINLNRALITEAKLAQIRDEGARVTLCLMVGGKIDWQLVQDRTFVEYRSLLLESYTINQEVGTGDGVNVSLVLKELRTAQSTTVRVKVPNAKTSLGRKGPADAKSAATDVPAAPAAPEEKKALGLIAVYLDEKAKKKGSVEAAAETGRHILKTFGLSGD